MNKQKMLCLAEQLEKLPAKYFNGYEWGSNDGSTKSTLENYSNCGTQACIAGWTCLFAGYKMDKRSDVYDEDDNRIGFVAVVAAKELELTELERMELFYSSVSGWNADSPKSAAKIIREFVKNAE